VKRRGLQLFTKAYRCWPRCEVTHRHV